MLVLRGYYTNSPLTFDTNGNLISKGTSGFGASEGRIFVKQVQLEPGKLTLTGVRPLDVLDQATQQWQIAPTATAVSIEVLLPADEPVRISVPRLIQSVFLNKAELAKADCSSADRQALLDFAAANMNGHKLDPKLPDVTNLNDAILLCMPGGDRGYRGFRGITPPHIRSAPDPKYTDAARNARLEGTTILLALIIPKGSPAAISIYRSLSTGLNDKLRPLGYQLDQRAVEAVSTWRFDPAKFQGEPVSVVINVEVNFRLY
jgi:TonB family protein